MLKLSTRLATVKLSLTFFCFHIRPLRRDLYCFGKIHGNVFVSRGFWEKPSSPFLAEENSQHTHLQKLSYASRDAQFLTQNHYKHHQTITKTMNTNSWKEISFQE